LASKYFERCPSNTPKDAFTGSIGTNISEVEGNY
jgi:hypothetical protein